MIVNTKFLGNVEIDPKNIVEFKNGLPGFSDLRNFVFLPVEGNDALSYLQSLEETNICFVLINPFLIIEDYEAEISEETVSKLEIEKPSDVQIFSILTIKENVKDITANLAAPIIINTMNNKAAQEILSDNRYEIKYKLYREE